MDYLVIFTLIGVAVAGLAAIVGIWMERDPRRPPRWAWALSILILMATLVSVFQSYLDAKAGEKLEEDMARMLQQLDKLAEGNPELQAFVTSELSAQARANPDVVEKLSDRVVEDGGDATEMLSKHMSASEVANLAKKGKVKKKKKSSAKPKAEEPKPEKKTPTSLSGRGTPVDKPAAAAAPVESAREPSVAPPEGSGRGRGDEEPAAATAPEAEAPALGGRPSAEKADEGSGRPSAGEAGLGSSSASDSKAAPSKMSKSGPSKKSKSSKKSKTKSKSGR
jgi:hypothetical protein